jgi:hypothetical protein
VPQADNVAMKLGVMRRWLTTMLACGILATGHGGAQEISAAARPVFVGYLTVGREMYFALAPQTGGSPMWLRRGEQINGYVIERYDRVTETLVVAQQTERIDLRLEGGARASTGVAAEPAITAAEALMIARLEVDRREHWKTPRLMPSKTHNGDHQFLVLSRASGKTDRRVVVITPAGDVKFYVTIPVQAHGGLPPLLFESFTDAVKRSGFK